MLTLYYSPAACSMASHVALEEATASFTAEKVDIFAGENLKPQYRAISPRSKVPALRFDDGRVLLETVAILAWVGTTYPDSDLLGADPIDRAQTIAVCAWLSGTVHPAFSQFVRPERFTSDKSSHLALRSHARETFWGSLREIDAALANRPWVMGDRFTVADPYVLVFYPWSRELELPVGELRNIAAMKERLVGRPAARRALEREGSVLLSM